MVRGPWNILYYNNLWKYFLNDKFGVPHKCLHDDDVDDDCTNVVGDINFTGTGSTYLDPLNHFIRLNNFIN